MPPKKKLPASSPSSTTKKPSSRAPHKRTSKAADPVPAEAILPPVIRKSSHTNEVGIGETIVLPVEVKSGKKEIYAGAGDSAMVISIFGEVLILEHVKSKIKFPYNRNRLN